MAGDKSPIEGVGEQLLDQIIRKNSANGQPQTFSEAVEAFTHAVDWSEEWLKYLLAFHISLWVVALLLPKRCGRAIVQAIVFFLSVLSVLGAERINSHARSKWEQFSKQNYFDESGFFVSVMLSIPMICLAIVILAEWVYSASSLMIVVKRHELGLVKGGNGGRGGKEEEGGEGKTGKGKRGKRKEATRHFSSTSRAKKTAADSKKNKNKSKQS